MNENTAPTTAPTIADCAAAALEEIFGPVIYAYTRADALEDGELVDISETAREAGITFPVAITRAAWEKCVAWTPEDSRRQTHQDESGRLWDVVWMFSRAARRGGSVLHFQFYCIKRGGRGVKARLNTLKAVCGPGDTAAPVITIMLPEES